MNVKAFEQTNSDDETDDSFYTDELDVAELENPIWLQIPGQSILENELVCAFYDDEREIWAELTCTQDHKYTESVASCCTNHLTSFALMNKEFLADSLATYKSTTQVFFGWELISVAVICFIALLVTCTCCLWTFYRCLTERKFYRTDLAKGNQQIA